MLKYYLNFVFNDMTWITKKKWMQHLPIFKRNCRYPPRPPPLPEILQTSDSILPATISSLTWLVLLFFFLSFLFSFFFRLQSFTTTPILPPMAAVYLFHNLAPRLSEWGWTELCCPLRDVTPFCTMVSSRFLLNHDIILCINLAPYFFFTLCRLGHGYGRRWCRGMTAGWSGYFFRCDGTRRLPHPLA